MSRKKTPQATMKSTKRPTKILFGENFLKYRVCVVHGIMAMLDADLAEIYGLSLDQFNEVVKNNIKYFDERHRFQLKKDEFKTLFPTLKQEQSKEMPYVFTEQGFYLLMIFLDGDEAVTQHMALLHFFKQLNDLLYPTGLTQLILQSEKNARDITELSAKIHELQEMTHNAHEKMDKVNAMIQKAKKNSSES